MINLIQLMGYVTMRLHILAGVALFTASLSSPQASAQTHASAAEGSCVSAGMIRQMSREGNSVHVSLTPELASQRMGSRENEKGIALTQAQDTVRTLKQAHTWFEDGARKGYAPAQVNLAVLSLEGWGTPPNAGTALYWLGEAARQGYALAYFDLGILYLRGCGVRQDYYEAFSQFERGANAGDPAAQMNLGYLYDRGLGVTQDRALAAIWYRKAAESGVAQAQYNLADLYARGEGVPRDESLALSWFQNAAQQGHTGARIMLGSMYAEGCGTEKNPQAAYEWISAAALQGDNRGSATLLALEHELTPEQLTHSKMRARALASSPIRTSPSELAFLH